MRKPVEAVLIDNQLSEKEEQEEEEEQNRLFLGASGAINRSIATAAMMMMMSKLFTVELMHAFWRYLVELLLNPRLSDFHTLLEVGKFEALKMRNLA